MRIRNFLKTLQMRANQHVWKKRVLRLLGRRTRGLGSQQVRMSTGMEYLASPAAAGA